MANAAFRPDQEQLRPRESVESGASGELSDDPEELEDQIERGAEAAEQNEIVRPADARLGALDRLGADATRTERARQKFDQFRGRAKRLQEDLQGRVLRLLRKGEAAPTINPDADEMLIEGAANSTRPNQPPVEPRVRVAGGRITEVPGDLDVAVMEAETTRIDPEMITTEMGTTEMEDPELELSEPMTEQEAKISDLRDEGKLAAALHKILETEDWEYSSPETIRDQQAVLVNALRELSARIPELKKKHDKYLNNIDNFLEEFSEGSEDVLTDDRGVPKLDKDNKPIKVKVYPPLFDAALLKRAQDKGRDRLLMAKMAKERKVLQGKTLDEWDATFGRTKKTEDATTTDANPTDSLSRDVLAGLEKVNVEKLALALNDSNIAKALEQQPEQANGMTDYVRTTSAIEHIDAIQRRLELLQRRSDALHSEQARPRQSDTRAFTISEADQDAVITKLLEQRLFEDRLAAAYALPENDPTKPANQDFLRLVNDPRPIADSFLRDTTTNEVIFNDPKVGGKFSADRVKQERKFATYEIKNTTALRQACERYIKSAKYDQSIGAAVAAGRYNMTIDRGGNIVMEVFVPGGVDEGSGGSEVMRRITMDTETSKKIFQAVDTGLVDEGRFSEDALKQIFGERVALEADPELGQNISNLADIEQSISNFSNFIGPLEQKFIAGDQSLDQAQLLSGRYQEMTKTLRQFAEDFPQGEDFSTHLKSLAANLEAASQLYNRYIELSKQETATGKPAPEKMTVQQQLADNATQRQGYLNELGNALEAHNLNSIKATYRKTVDQPERAKAKSKFAVGTAVNLPNEQFLGRKGKTTWKVAQTERGVNILQRQTNKGHEAKLYIVMTDQELAQWLYAAEQKTKPVAAQPDTASTPPPTPDNNPDEPDSTQIAAQDNSTPAATPDTHPAIETTLASETGLDQAEVEPVTTISPMVEIAQNAAAPEPDPTTEVTPSPEDHNWAKTEATAYFTKRLEADKKKESLDSHSKPYALDFDIARSEAYLQKIQTDNFFDPIQYSGIHNGHLTTVDGISAYDFFKNIADTNEEHRTAFSGHDSEEIKASQDLHNKAKKIVTAMEPLKPKATSTQEELATTRATS